jgi:hypothetical protein
MALKKTVTTPHGFDAFKAYHRVESVILESKSTMTFHIRSYVNTDKPFFSEDVMTAPYSLDGVNPIAQAYAHLKTLPEFADAVDC